MTEFDIALKQLADKKIPYKHLIKVGEESSEFKTEVFKTLNKGLSISNERFVNELSDLLNTIEIYFTSLNIEYTTEYEEKFDDKSPQEIVIHMGKIATKTNDLILNLIQNKVENKIPDEELDILLIEEKLIHRIKKVHRNIYKYLKFVKISLEDLEEYRYKQITKHL